MLYFVVKNHSFLDGNKRIGAALFLYFLERNETLFSGGRPIVSNGMLVAATLMVAESKPEEKEAMVALIMSLLDLDAEELRAMNSCEGDAADPPHAQANPKADFLGATF